MSAHLVDQDFEEMVSIRWRGVSGDGKPDDEVVARLMKLRDAMVLVSTAVDPRLRENVTVCGRNGSWQSDEIIAAYHMMKSQPK